MSIKAFRAFPGKDRLLLCVGYLLDPAASQVFASDKDYVEHTKLLDKAVEGVEEPIKSTLLLSLLYDAASDSL